MTGKITDIFNLISALMRDGESFCVATVVRTENATSAKAGAKAVILPDGTIRGFLGGGCVQGAVRRTALTVLEEAQPRMIRVKPKGEVVTQLDLDGTELHKSGCPSGGTVDIFIEPMQPAPRLVVCGATPVAVAIADLGRRMGYRIAVAAAAEDQDAFADAEHRSTDFGLRALDIAAGDFVIVATQGKRDREALGAALGSDASYVAFVGSRRKAATLCQQLKAQGMAVERIARLSSPAGLNIHAIEPAEIAVSILAEIVAVRRCKARDLGEAEPVGAGLDAGSRGA